MSTHILRDQRGTTMLLELVLAALVLALIGLALYQSNHSTNNMASEVRPGPTVATAGNEGSVTAAAVVQAAGRDAAVSASADSAADQFTATDNDVTNLGNSFNANNF